MPLINDMFQEENYGGERDLGHGEMSFVLENLSKHRLSARGCRCPDWISLRFTGNKTDPPRNFIFKSDTVPTPLH